MGYRNNSLHHFNDILAENEMKPVISKVARPYSEEYIRQFDEGELRNPFTRADGPVYRIAQLLRYANLRDAGNVEFAHLQIF